MNSTKCKRFINAVFLSLLLMGAMNHLFGNFAGHVYGQDTRTFNLTWDANSEPDLSHYIVYWGTESREYDSNSGNIGLVTEYSVTLPDNGEDYYFAVTAVDEAGLESDYSNEVNTEGPNPPGILKIRVVVEIDVTG